MSEVELEVEEQEAAAANATATSTTVEGALSAAETAEECVQLVEVFNSLNNNVRAGRVPLFVCLSENYQNDTVLDQILRFAHLTFQVTPRHNTLHYITLLHYIILYCIILYCIILYYIVLYCTILYYIVLYCTILYYIVLYHIVLY